MLGHHKIYCFFLSFFRKRYMNSHLISVKIRIITCAYTRMKSDSRSLYQNWVKSLNAQFMKSWGPIQKNRMIFGNFFQNIKYFRRTLLYKSLCGFYIRSKPSDDNLA